MNYTVASQVEHLVTERIGLKLRASQLSSLRTKTESRISALNLSCEDEYCQLLNDGGPVAEVEWQYITGLLTNKESYFFRDKGQMLLLRDYILPELIDRNKATQTLRVWSAGCSTGEEAYTLSMLIDELRPKLNLRNWKITIIGTDIDSKVLRHARRGIYGTWSFRMIDPATKQRYFRHKTEGWEVLEPVYSSVVFMDCNLVADKYPNSSVGLCDMDLILCRNVFIYFEPRAVEKVLCKFSQTLRDGGYLMTGHVETRGLAVAPFNSRCFPESELYQKGGPTLGKKSKPVQVRHPSPVALPRHARNAVKRTEPPPVALSDRPGRQQGSEREKTLVVLAQSLADFGQYDEAVQCCQKLILEFPFLASPYQILASIAQERGQREDAKAMLKKALYLSPEEPYTYMELGAIYSDEGDRGRARKMFASALELLRHLAPDSIVGFSGRPNAGECIKHLTEMSDEGA